MSNRFLEEYLIYFNFWLMQEENVRYLAISENYWYRTKSEKPGLWVKMTWGQNQIVLSLIHLLMTKSSLILASDTSWRNLIIDNISNFQKKTHTPPPKCGQRSNCFKMLHFEHFDVILKIEPDLRWLMSQKVLFWWWAHILRFTSRWIFNVFFFAEKFSIMIDFQKGQNCLRNSPKCLLKRHLFLENTKLLVSNRYMTLTHFKTKCCLDDDKSSIFDVEIGHNAAFQA